MRTASYLFPLSILIFVNACGGAEDDQTGTVVEVHDEPVLVTPWEDYRDAARAAAHGENFYRTEWDIVFFTEADLRAHYEDEVNRTQNKLAVFKQNSTGYEPLFSRTEALKLIYCVSNSFSNKSTVVADMATATASWQRVTNVRFRYDSSQDASCDQSNANVDFAVMPTTQPTLAGCAASKKLWSAVGGCPVGGSGVNGVLLMQYAIIPGSPPNHGWTPAGVMAHELGHMIGFRHEHPWAPSQGGCGEAPTITPLDLTGRRLTDYDQLSVMHYPACGGISGKDFSISFLDGVGARQIYGMPVAVYGATKIL